jgi:hypothetical protein
MAWNWRSFRDKDVTDETIDHQHLSNIFWYYRILIGSLDNLPAGMKQTLDDKFNGQLLPYRPHIKFEAEIKDLEESGYLVWHNSEKKNGDIYVHDEWVGEVIKPFFD